MPKKLKRFLDRNQKKLVEYFPKSGRKCSSLPGEFPIKRSFKTRLIDSEGEFFDAMSSKRKLNLDAR